MNGLKIKILNDEYAMHQLPPDGKIPKDVFKADFYSITRTDAVSYTHLTLPTICSV